jgi:hypothetical protein
LLVAGLAPSVRRRQATTGAPLSQTFALDEGGVGFVEGGIAGQIEALVRQLVEDGRGHLVVVPAQHAAEQRIAEPAQGRIGRHAADVGVLTLRLQPLRLSSGLGFPVVAAIGHATGDGKAVGGGSGGEFGGGEDIPQHEGSLEFDETAIAGVVRQSQFGTGEASSPRGGSEAFAQGDGPRGICDDRRNGLAITDQRPLALYHLSVVPDRGTTAQSDQEGQQRQPTARALRRQGA